MTTANKADRPRGKGTNEKLVPAAGSRRLEDETASILSKGFMFRLVQHPKGSAR